MERPRSLWLYPISIEAKRVFEVGRREIPVSAKSFGELVRNGRINDPSNRAWNVWQNLRKAAKEDEVFIYAGRADGDAGIIGWGEILDVYPQYTWRDGSVGRAIALRIDLAKSRQLLAKPIPGPKVRNWIKWPRAPLLSLSDFEKELRKLLPWTPNATTPSTGPKAGPKEDGGGIGQKEQDTEQNKEIEGRAVRHVREGYKKRRWKVVSREKDNIGYDLQCTKGRREEHVEVKGTKRSGGSFPITSQEYERMKTDPDFILARVGNALSSHPILRRWSAQNALDAFEFQKIISISYKAMLKHR